jgi:DNA-binding CsgD family transcriptional regulator
MDRDCVERALDRDFIERCYRVCEAFARKCFQTDDDKFYLAIALAWWAWRNATPEQRECPPSVWARAGVRAVNAGRDLPGVQTSHRWGGDPLEREDTWIVPSLEGHADHRPGPVAEAIYREGRVRFESDLNARERDLYGMVTAGLGTTEIAQILGVTAGAVSQARRRMAERYLRMDDRR